MKDIKTKAKMLGQLASAIGKNPKKSLKDYMQEFKGTDEELHTDENLRDQDLINNIKKSYKKKSVC